MQILTPNDYLPNAYVYYGRVFALSSRSSATAASTNVAVEGLAPLLSLSYGASATSEAPVRFQKDFVSTPLFMTINVTNDEDGIVMFNAPQNLGTFVIRAYAATGEP